MYLKIMEVQMKFIKKLLLIILVIVIIVGSIIFLNGYKLYKTTLDNLSLSDKITQIKNNENYVYIGDVPDYYTNAIIAVEDHRFKNHGAIDIIAILRATVSNIQAKEFNEGGSTITPRILYKYHLFW